MVKQCKKTLHHRHQQDSSRIVGDNSVFRRDDARPISELSVASRFSNSSARTPSKTAAALSSSRVEPSIKQGGVQIWPDKIVKPFLCFGGLEDHSDEVMEEERSEEISRAENL